ncbi:MAG: hypothetical protein KGS46_15890 [Chloroflexi bacterium]|nr:hypothetical protein [Chloroflexota bacterium]
MSEFGLNVETVAEGVLILIDTLKNHGIKIKLSDDHHNGDDWYFTVADGWVLSK